MCLTAPDPSQDSTTLTSSQSLTAPDSSQGSAPPPPPTDPRTICRYCNSLLGLLKLCSGLGLDIQNYNRWYQACSNKACDRLEWYGPRTPLEAIPQEVQLAHALNASLRQDQHTTGTVYCANPNCRSHQNGRPRRANKECVRVPPFCSVCCTSCTPLVKCKAHRLSAVENTVLCLQPYSPSATSSAASASITLSSTPTTSTSLSSAPTASMLSSLASNMSITPSDLTLSAIPTPSSVLAATTTPQSSVPAAPPKLAGRSYARPLEEGYAKPWLMRHRVKEEKAALVDATRKVQVQVINTVTVLYWARVCQHGLAAPFEPCLKAKVASSHSGVLVLSEHMDLVDAVPADAKGRVKVYNAAEREWFTQALALPVPVPLSRRVLVRNLDLDDDDCPDLDSEVLAAGGNGKRSRRDSVLSTPTKVRKFSHETTPTASRYMPIPEVECLDSATSEGTGQLAALAAPPSPSPLTVRDPVLGPGPSAPPGTSPAVKGGRNFSPIPFPPRFACDMDARMPLLVGVSEKHEEHFARAFPGSKFVSSTFQRHRNYYIAAKKYGILEPYVAAGQTPQGLWRTIWRRLTALTSLATGPQEQPIMVRPPLPSEETQPSVSSNFSLTRGQESAPSDLRAPTPPPPSPSSFPSLSQSSSSPHIARIEWFDGFGTQFGSRWSADTEAVEVWVSNKPVRSGRLKDIFTMGILVPKRFSDSAYFAKAVRISNLPPYWHRDFSSAWDVQYREAYRLARAGDIAAMFLFEAIQEHQAFVHSASSLRHNYGQLTIPSHLDPSGLLARTLSAFSHYSLERHGLCFDNFEGVYVDTVPTFYGCKTHSSHAHVEDSGKFGINLFAASHVCNSICHAIGLSALEVDANALITMPSSS
ncbi:hypothetical protein K466DRAFT_483681 [Polyporus arcularius HHB13444]|uniref:Alpha-type protein kinase domain-containing protein n=1 Tax=Polyporus arcularius HHB13444 TaxID=1314778 RepID=A0A5C3PMJ8_9APHY|nr:hypothetical protein K466DRAFT_483681 [Polyporus arcularius HHB13444]